jgi:hypothetical protein
VIYDVTTEEQMIEFGLKLKSLRNFGEGISSVHAYYFPNLG